MPIVRGKVGEKTGGIPVEYRNLGRTGTKVSMLCLGCLMFGGRTNESDSMDIIDRAIDAGCVPTDFFSLPRATARSDSKLQTLEKSGQT